MRKHSKGEDTAPKVPYTIGFIVIIFLVFFMTLQGTIRPTLNDLCRKEMQNQLSSVLETASQLETGAFLLAETKHMKICEQVKCIYRNLPSNPLDETFDIQMRDSSVNWIKISPYKRGSFEWIYEVNGNQMVTRTGGSVLECDPDNDDFLKPGLNYTVEIQPEPLIGKMYIRFRSGGQQ